MTHVNSADRNDDLLRQADQSTIEAARSLMRKELTSPERLDPWVLIEYVRILPDKSPRVDYNLACTYSLAAGEQRDRREEHLDRGIEFLRRTISRMPPLERRGLMEYAQIDSDLRALREERGGQFLELRKLVPPLEERRVPPQ